MTGVEAVRSALESTQKLLMWFLGDLSDRDLLVRAVPGANHIAWQLGHLIQTETKLGGQPGFKAVYPVLPAGFDKQHGKEAQMADPPAGFPTKAEYVDLLTKVRETTLAGVGRLSDAELETASTGPMAQWAPTLGSLLLLTANHTLMHAGQFSVVRRKIGKPVLF
jgi:hypothetical protein